MPAAASAATHPVEWHAARSSVLPSRPFSCQQAHRGGMPDRDLCVALGRTGDHLAVAAAHLTHGGVCFRVLAIDLARLAAAKESGSIRIITRREGAARVA